MLGRSVSFLVLMSLVSAVSPVIASDSGTAAWDLHRSMAGESIFRGLHWRCVGPVVQGGRLVDIEVFPGRPYTFYVAYASGGLWRTENNGITFEPLFDRQRTMIMGDVAIDPSDPMTIWVGTGENNSSRSSYGGAGLFRSRDGGKTWEHAGLGGSDRIGRIVIDPDNPDRVWVAVLGKLYTAGGERGVYRTTDGGRSWQNVLPGDEDTGFVDLVLDPKKPDTIYAAAWERSRRPWDFVESGAGSGIFKSVDGGDNWRRLGNGLPSGEHVGRIGLAVCGSDSKIVYAFIDNQKMLPEEEWDLGDGAVTPKRLRTMSREQFLEQSDDEVERFLRDNDLDPELDAEKLKNMVEEGDVTINDLLDALGNANTDLFRTDIRGAEVYRSDDGGENWHRTHDQPLRQTVHTYGYYFGQIRVSPTDPDRIYVLGVPLIRSDDGGKTFRGLNRPNMHGDHQAMWIDPSFPERVIGGNDGGLNMSFDGGASWLKLNSIPVGQFYTVSVDMADPYNIYGGLQDNGVMTGSSLSIPGVTPEWRRIGGGDGMYVQVDPRDNATTYIGYQFGNYTRIDADGSRTGIKPHNKLKEPALRYNWSTPVILSTHNPDIVYFGANKLFRSMNRGESWTAISPDLTVSQKRGDVPYATITTLSESPVKFGLLWSGTDDGQVHVSPDGGVTWNRVVEGLPADRWVSRVEASAHAENTAYISLNGYRDDDQTAYIFKTDDLGKNWIDISEGLPDEAVNVIREDPVRKGLLYVGTDRGAYASLDNGSTWSALSGGLPNVPVHDMVVHPRERELLAGTHGRSVWVLDVLPVQELSDDVRKRKVHIFPLEDIDYDRGWNRRRSLWWHRPEMDPSVRIPYWSKDPGQVTLSVRGEKGEVLRNETLEAMAGMNQYTWDLLLDPESDPVVEAVRLGRPPYITPGSYTIVLEVGDDSSETCFEVNEPEPLEPRVKPEPRIRGEKK